MSKRLHWLAIPLGLVLLFAFVVQSTRADDPPGAKLYTTYCAACHGAAGKGGVASAVGSEKYLSARDDAAITQATRDGVPGKGMPAWSKSKGGTLTDDQIADIVAYLRSLGPASAPVPSTGTPPTGIPVFAQTKLTVTQSTNADGDAILSATLKKYDGTPVSDARITFSRATTFGVIDLGTVKTDANGVAALVLPQVPSSANEVAAVFKGDKDWDASTAKIALEPPGVATSFADVNTSDVRLSVDEPLLPPEGSLITPNPPLLPTTIFALIVGGVWATYGYVMYQVYGIWKRGRTVARSNVLRMIK